MNDEDPVQEERRLRYLLPGAIRDKQFTLLSQTVLLTASKEELHREIFLRLEDPESPGENMPAGKFMPVAEAAGLAADVDRMVLTMLFEQWGKKTPDFAMAINMSSASLELDGQLQWVLSELEKKPGIGKYLVLEWAEYKVISHLESMKHWITTLSPLGVKFSIDQFGKSFCSFAYLQETKVDYLKIDGTYSQSLEKNGRNQFFIMSLHQIATGLGMQVIAQSVETQEVWERLQTLGIAGGQGYWLGRVN